MKKSFLIFFSLLVSMILIGCDDAKKAAAIVTHISIETPAQNTTLFVGDTFSYEGMQIRVHTGDPINSYLVDVTESIIDPVNTDEPGVKTVEIRYVVDEKSHTTSFEVTVLAVDINALEIVDPPLKTEYFEGETFDPTGMVVKVHYSNGAEIITTNYTYSQTPLTANNTSVVIQYDTHSISVDITVTPVILTSVSIMTNPVQLTYYEGDVFNPEGLVINAHYNNGIVSPVTSYTYTSEPLSVGTEFITITYQTKTLTIDITVEEVVMTSISIDQNPDKVSYYVHETFDQTGLIVKGHYNNGTSVIITEYTWDIDVFNLDDNVIKIIVGSLFTELAITVMDIYIVEIYIEQYPLKQTYVEGDLFEPDGLIVKAIYNSGYEAIIEDFEYPLENLTTDDEVITIQYLGFEAGLTITVYKDYSAYPFPPAVNGTYTYTPLEPIENMISGLYISRLYRSNYMNQPTTYVEGSFPDPFMIGADYYILEVLNNEGLWVSYLIYDEPVILEYDNFSIPIFESHTLRLRVVGGEYDGYVTNVVETGYTGFDTFFNYWGLDESVYISDIMVPFVGRGLEFSIGAISLEDGESVADSLLIQWYRVNPMTFELILIDGANDFVYITKDADIGHYLLVRAYGDGESSGGYLQMISYWGVLKPIQGYVTDLSDDGFTLILDYDIALNMEELFLQDENFENIADQFVITYVAPGIYEFTGDLKEVEALFIYLENASIVLVEADGDQHMMHQGITVIGYEPY
ncbi:MAG: bacterial Ig-like domain-containing protein [Candidatus Izemoplasmataceae bacterium]